MGKVEASAIPNRKHAKLIDVSTPHKHEDIALHTLKADRLEEGFFKFRRYITFSDRRIDIYDRECGIKWISKYKPTIDLYQLKSGKLRGKLNYECWDTENRCVYINLRNTVTNEIIAQLLMNDGSSEKEMEQALDISKITENAPVQAEFGICAWCPYSENHPWFYYIVVELDYEYS